MNTLTTAQLGRRSLGEGGFAESEKLAQAINSSAVALAKVEANLRGLGYGS